MPSQARYHLGILRKEEFRAELTPLQAVGELTLSVGELKKWSHSRPGSVAQHVRWRALAIHKNRIQLFLNHRPDNPFKACLGVAVDGMR
jgi:hypothetical protein